MEWVRKGSASDFGYISGLSQPISPHTFRRTCASPFHVQALLGHTTLEMTRRYCRAANQDLAALQRQHGVVDGMRSSPGISPRRHRR